MTLKDRLERFVKKHGGFVAKGELERIVVQHTEYTADNAGRRLRELARAGILEVKEIKGHAHYRYRGDPNAAQLDWFNSLPV